MVHNGDLSGAIIVEKDSTSTEVIIIITIIIFLFFFGYIIYLTLNSNENSNENSNIKSEGKEKNKIFCSPGQCATNLITGEKRCPNLDSTNRNNCKSEDFNCSKSVSINPEKEVCNSPYSCENSLTPYAVKLDESTDLNGQCEPGVICRCINKPQCANYVLSIFEQTNGNIHQGLPGTNTILTQTYSFVDSAGYFQTTPPLSYDNPETQFCSIPSDLVFGVTTLPPGGVISPEIASDGTKQSLIQETSPASRIWPTSCVQGALAFVPSNPATFTTNDFKTTSMSCVIGNSSLCTSDEYPYWDNRINTMCCINKDNDVRCPIPIKNLEDSGSFVGFDSYDATTEDGTSYEEDYSFVEEY